MNPVESQTVDFFRDDHCYVVDGGRKVPSVTQILQLSGAISYVGIRPEVLSHAATRGTLVHEAAAMYDRGIDVETQCEIPEEIVPYFAAWKDFVREFDFIAEQDEIERPRVVTVAGFEYAMTPDAIGTMRGVPTVIERKCTAAPHKSWGLQLAAYEAGAKRPAGYRNYKRVAVQLKPDGTFRPYPFEDPADFGVFAAMHVTATWILNNRLVKLAA